MIRRASDLWLGLAFSGIALSSLLLAGLGLSSFVACSGERPAAASAGGGMAMRSTPSVATFTSDGQLVRPRDYRRWVFVGAPLTPNDMNDGHAAFPEFHSVYIDPASYDAYKRDGVWRDGTMLVKELVSVGTKSASSGAGYFMGDFLGVEVALKDRARFPSEPGNWGYFRFTDENGGPPHARATRMPTSACATCHSTTAQQDLVFTQHYPVLRAAKGAGMVEPENM